MAPDPLPTDLPTALAEIERLRARVAALTAERDELVADLSAVRADRDKLVRRFFGKKSERIGPEQSLLFSSSIAALPEPAAGKVVEQVKAHPRRRGRRRRHPGRGCYPKDLQRIEERVPTPPELLECACGAHRRQIGEARSERLDLVPAQFRIVEKVRAKLACVACEQVVSPPLPPEPIQRGLPTPRLLAQVVVSKYCDHLPLARQETCTPGRGSTSRARP